MKENKIPERVYVDIYSIKSVAQWVNDRRSGEMIECLNYTKQYLGLLPQVSQKELDAICSMFNKYVLHKNENMHNQHGEILLTIK